jgi:hypothetical protein
MTEQFIQEMYENLTQEQILQMEQMYQAFQFEQLLQELNNEEV